MHWKLTSLWGGKKVELRETQRAVTPFGGLVVFVEFLQQVGYREAVSQHLPFRLTSPNAIDPVETFTAFLLSVVAGARRFAHTSLLRADVALHGLLGMKRFPVDDTIRNLFKRFGQGNCQRFFSGLWSWQLERLPECSSGYSLDLDSTVFGLGPPAPLRGDPRAAACRAPLAGKKTTGCSRLHLSRLRHQPGAAAGRALARLQPQGGHGKSHRRTETRFRRG